MKKYQVENKCQLIPTNFPTIEECEFWADFSKQHINTDETLPVSIFWIDKQLRNVYANRHALKGINAPAKNVIGHTPYNFLPPEIADSIVDSIKFVQENDQQSISEHITTDYISGDVAYWETTISPLHHSETGQLMGFYSASINITPEKKTEVSISEFDELANQLVQEMNSLMNSYRIKMLYNKIGKQPPSKNNANLIQLTKREKTILYLLSLHRSPKDIAGLLSRIDGKSVSHFTIHSLIGKGLYTKFDVTNTKDLLDKASSYGLIPAILA